MPICCGYSEERQRKNFILAGLDDSGKTYLLYKLKIRHVDSNKLRKTLKEIKSKCDEHGDPGYHYEEFARPYPYAIWEFPGSLRRFWPMVYRSVDTSGVIFVVDCNETVDRMALARKELHRFIHANELRQAGIAVLINLRRTKTSGPIPKIFDSENPFKYLLGLDELLPTAVSRVKMFATDVSLVVNENHKIWLDILDFFRRVANSANN